MGHVARPLPGVFHQGVIIGDGMYVSLFPLLVDEADNDLVGSVRAGAADFPSSYSAEAEYLPDGPFNSSKHR